MPLSGRVLKFERQAVSLLLGSKTEANQRGRCRLSSLNEKTDYRGAPTHLRPCPCTRACSRAASPQRRCGQCTYCTSSSPVARRYAAVRRGPWRRGRGRGRGRGRLRPAAAAAALAVQLRQSEAGVGRTDRAVGVALSAAACWQGAPEHGGQPADECRD